MGGYLHRHLVRAFLVTRGPGSWARVLSVPIDPGSRAVVLLISYGIIRREIADARGEIVVVSAISHLSTPKGDIGLLYDPRGVNIFLGDKFYFG